MDLSKCSSLKANIISVAMHKLKKLNIPPEKIVLDALPSSDFEIRRSSATEIIDMIVADTKWELQS